MTKDTGTDFSLSQNPREKVVIKNNTIERKLMAATKLSFLNAVSAYCGIMDNILKKLDSKTMKNVSCESMYVDFPR